MAEENAFLDGGESLGAWVGRRWDSSSESVAFGRLGGADYISLAALLVAWTSAVLLVSGEPNWALVAMFGAYALDKLDGFYARRYGEPSPFGRQLDSFVDVFVYLVTGALLFHFAIAPHPVVGLVGGFALLTFGGLRLVRHAQEGFGEDGDTSYYVGLTVVHANLVVVATYFLGVLLPVWSAWASAAAVLAVCPLMISRYKSYKTAAGHALAGGLGACGVALALALELGYLGGA